MPAPPSPVPRPVSRTYPCVQMFARLPDSRPTLLQSLPMSHPKEPRNPREVGASDVDVTLIDAMLAISPEERLRQNDRMVRTIEELRHGFAALRARDPACKAGGERD